MGTSKIYKAVGIILKRRNLGEGDRVITLFSKEYGKITILARGVRRVTSRRLGHLEIFSQVVVLLHRGKTWDSLSEVESINTFPLLRRYLTRVSLAYYFCELVDSLVPEMQEHRDVFDLLTQALSKLNQPRVPRSLGVVFSQELLRLLGFLALGKTLSRQEIVAYIENITERRLKTPRLLTKVVRAV